MDEERWAAIDDWLAERLLPADPALEGALDASAAAGLPPIGVAPLQGRFLSLLVGLTGARRILEVGTLGGYSTIWLARALPADGRLVTLELEPAHAAVADGNLRRAGLADRVDIRVGPAAGSLAAMVAAGEAAFDLVFIDADKPGTSGYLTSTMALAHPGTAIVVDNVVRGGALVERPDDPNAAGMRRAIEQLAADDRVEATVLQTVGVKGHDGFALIRVR